MRRPSLASFAPLALALSALSAGCASAGTSLVTLMPGVVNDPANRTMRRELMGFGTGEFCKEVQVRGVPLKLRDDGPSMGRFYAETCDYRELESGDSFVQLSGFGYAWTQATSRIGFTASGAVQYNPDFLLDGKTMYAYFRPRNVQSTQFKAEMVEVQQQGLIGGLLSGTAQDLSTRIGGQIISQELSRGFTVLREDNGQVDFGLGIIEKGQRPLHPYQVHGSSKIMAANDWTEVHSEQREFIGPITITEKNRALFVTASLDGIDAVDLLLVRKDMGDYWLRQYAKQPGVTPLPGQPLMSDVLRKGADSQRTIPVSKGQYYLVIDNSSSAGNVAPPPGVAGILGTTDTPAVVKYVVQIGDAP